MKGKLTAIVLLALAASGCQSRGIVLYNTKGQQRVWPYFVDQPMVLAFWNATDIQCIDDLPALNTLHYRPGPVHVMGVASGSERLDANKWMRRMKVTFEVVYDPNETLARRLRVRHYPTYVFFDYLGNELGRSTTIRTIHNWFDRERWIRRATGRPERARVVPAARSTRPQEEGNHRGHREEKEGTQRKKTKERGGS